MDRRQLLHAVNAVGAGAALPTWASSSADSTAITPMVTSSAGEDRPAVEVIDAEWHIPKIGLVAVGEIGGGCLARAGHRIPNLPYIDRTIAIENSSLALSFISADHKIRVGDGKTPVNPTEAEHLTDAARLEIAKAVAGLDMVFLVAGMAGRTGARTAPIVTQMLRHHGIFTLGFAVMPLDSEGAQRQEIAAACLQELRRHSHAQIPASRNDMSYQNEEIKWLAFAAQRAHLALIQLCRGITNSVARTDLVGIDFKDLQNVILGQEGHCAFGFGSSSGVNTATVAAQRAIDDPMLGQRRLQQASAALVTIETPPQAAMAVLHDAKLAMNFVRSQMSPNANIIYGATVNLDQSDKFTVSILASGIQDA